MQPIAVIYNDYTEKFGVPRQSGLVPSVMSEIIFEPTYRNPDALRGLEDFSHLWLLWEFSKSARNHWSPTVRPPRLGGNQRMGVFATRSPFRPNAIGLSCVKLEKIVLHGKNAPVIYVSGADLMNGTPILDIKPYLPYADCKPDATGGFTDSTARKQLQVECPESVLSKIPSEKQQALLEILAQDPRPSYQNDPDKIYGMKYADRDVKFQVCNDILIVIDIT